MPNKVEQLLTTSPRQFDRHPPALANEINKLERWTQHPLPHSYLDFLRFSNGGYGPLAVQPYTFVADDIDYVLELNANPHYADWLKDFVVIGNDGAGELIALDFRVRGTCSVVAIDACNSNLDEVLPIAPDFDSFLLLVGIEPDLPEQP